MTNFKPFLAQVVIICLIVSVSNCIAQEQAVQPNTKVVLASEVDWQQLNPKRGDKSPQAATLWGDRNGTEATGFLVKFADGFSSPPHIHNVTYRGVVVDGLVHNDDPDAKPMWMPTGSFWTQPAGEVHITSAMGESTVAFIEIEKGPYLVLPTDQAFDRGERPVNVDPTNTVWLDASNTTWIEPSANKTSSKMPEIAFLWGSPQDEKLNGSLVKLPAGFRGEIRSKSAPFRAVVIDGKIDLKVQVGGKGKTLASGSYFSSNGKAAHQISCESEGGCIVYIRNTGTYKVVSK